MYMKYKEFFKEDILPGGKGDDTTEKSVDPKELSMGIKVEKEHTHDDKLAKEIALDHLTEDPHYYSRLKMAGLADELKENDLMGFQILPPSSEKSSMVVEPDTTAIDKKTVPGTVFPKVDLTKKPDMGGCIGNTTGEGSDTKTDVESPAKDPTPTDHVTGGMGNSPSNPNILFKSPSQQIGDKNQIMTVAQSIVPKDISIDIAESKKILKKMLIETTISPQHFEALCDYKGDWKVYKPSQHGTWAPVTNVLSKKEALQVADEMNKKTSSTPVTNEPQSECITPVAGNPNTDPAFVTGKRWTVRNRSTSPLK